MGEIRRDRSCSQSIDTPIFIQPLWGKLENNNKLQMAAVMLSAMRIGALCLSEICEIIWRIFK